jgi:hypothetical protein
MSDMMVIRLLFQGLVNRKRAANHNGGSTGVHVTVYGFNSSVGIATGYKLDNRGLGVRFKARTGNFSLLRCV